MDRRQAIAGRQSLGSSSNIKLDGCTTPKSDKVMFWKDHAEGLSLAGTKHNHCKQKNSLSHPILWDKWTTVVQRWVTNYRAEKRFWGHNTAQLACWTYPFRAWADQVSKQETVVHTWYLRRWAECASDMAERTHKRDSQIALTKTVLDYMLV